MNQQSPKSFVLLFLVVFTSDVCAAGDSPEVHDDSRVTFRVAAPKAGKVLLLGDWLKPGEELAMTKGNDGIWTTTAGPFPPGNHIYAFEFDGVPVPDPEKSSD